MALPESPAAVKRVPFNCVVTTSPLPLVLTFDVLKRIEEGIKRNQSLLENNPKPAKVDLINEKISFLTAKKEEISNYE